MNFYIFRKIHGINTYHNEVFFMDSASILTISANHINLKKYWYPDFTKIIIHLIKMHYN